MNFYAFSGLLTGLAATVSGILVFGKKPSNLKHRAYALYCLAASIWGYGYGAWHLSSSHEEALFYVQLLMAGAIFLPSTYVFHVLTLVERVEDHQWLLRLGWGLSVFFFFINFTPYFVSDVRPAGGFQYWPTAGPFFHLYLLGFCVFSIYGTWLLFQRTRTRHGTERSRFVLLTLGSTIAHVGGFTTFPLWYDINIPPNGAILITVYTSVVAYTLLRYRVLDLGTALERGMTTSLLLTLIALPAYPVLLLGQQWYLGSINVGYSLIELFVFLLLVFVASSLKTRATTFVTKAFFTERYDQYKTILNFSKSLVSILELQNLTSTIVQSICPTLGIKWGALYLQKAGSQNYQPVSCFGKPLENFSKIDLGHTSSLVDRWREGISPFALDELKDSMDDTASQSIVTQLATMETEICLPLVNKNRLLGLCVFGPMMNNGGGYTTQDLELLATLSLEASVALDNALLYEELKRSQSLVRRTDRLRSLETMAGGLAHEIRNPLTSIKAFVELAPERKDDEQFLARFSKIVQKDVFRIERLTREILDYAKPIEPFLREEDLNDIMESCLYTLRVRPSHELITIETDLVPGLPKIYADRQQLKQVFLNFLFNAVEAMFPNGGVLTVRTQHLKSHETIDWVQVEIQDTGSGISSEDIEHIFDPFFTTKHESEEHEGTGLGLAIAHQIIQEHQGKIEVQSVKGRGTTFFVRLPSSQSQAPVSSMSDEGTIQSPPPS